MEGIRRHLVRLLIGANALAFAFVVSAGPASAFGGVDGCDEEEVEGCDCINTPSPPWTPVGCYDNLGDEHLCTTGEECGGMT